MTLLRLRSALRAISDGPLRVLLTNLAYQFDLAFNLSQLGGPERQVYLEQAADPVVRERIAAERRAELERKRDADRRAVERSYGVVPGTPRGVLVAARPALLLCR